MDVLKRSFCFLFFFFPPFSSETQDYERVRECASTDSQSDRREMARLLTWFYHRLWRGRGTTVQLQKGLLESLTEGILEAGHGNAIRAVALTVAVCRWGGKQLVCMGENAKILLKGYVQTTYIKFMTFCFHRCTSTQTHQTIYYRKLKYKSFGLMII